jgi:hypothetical protein
VLWPGGGDGTLNEVVGALMQHREAIARQGLSIALIPLGTANDFACTAGISVVSVCRMPRGVGGGGWGGQFTAHADEGNAQHVTAIVLLS